MDKELKKQGIKKREQIYQFIVKYITAIGYAPTIKEICNAVGLKSTSSVYNHLVQLETDGKIEMKPYSPRAIKVVGYQYKKAEDWLCLQ